MDVSLRETLNPLELVLLASYLGKSGDEKGAKAVASLLRRKAEANEVNVNQRNKCFDCILKLNELKKPEEDGKTPLILEFKEMLEEELKDAPPPKLD